jgi:very-short-patch-repair endonuclease
LSDEIARYFHERLGAFIRNHVDDESARNGLKPDQWLIDEIYSISADWDLGRPLCESPIEERLFAALITSGDGYGRLACCPDGHQGATKFATHLCPQAPVLDYRVDFLLTHYIDHEPTFRIAIECDGHDFHERTKEQAKRDKSRDRALAAADITVFRFTGSEIFRDAEKCCEEVERLLSRKIDAVIAQKCRVRELA